MKKEDMSDEMMSSESMVDEQEAKVGEVNLSPVAAKTLSEENGKKTLKDAVKRKNKRKKKKTTTIDAD